MAEKLRVLNTGPSLVAAALALAFGTARYSTRPRHRPDPVWRKRGTLN